MWNSFSILAGHLKVFLVPLWGWLTYESRLRSGSATLGTSLSLFIAGMPILGYNYANVSFSTSLVSHYYKPHPLTIKKHHLPTITNITLSQSQTSPSHYNKHHPLIITNITLSLSNITLSLSQTSLSYYHKQCTDYQQLHPLLVTPLPGLFISLINITLTFTALCTTFLSTIITASPTICSGGCGRTGTYIAICLLIDRLKTEGVVDVFQTVRALRLQRPGMVRSTVSHSNVVCTCYTWNALAVHLQAWTCMYVCTNRTVQISNLWHNYFTTKNSWIEDGRQSPETL